MGGPRWLQVVTAALIIVGTLAGTGYLVTMLKPYDYGPESISDGRLFDRPSYFKFAWRESVLRTNSTFLNHSWFETKPP